MKRLFKEMFWIRSSLLFVPLFAIAACSTAALTGHSHALSGGTGGGNPSPHDGNNLTDQTPRDRLRYSLIYDEASETLSYDAWVMTASGPSTEQLSGRLSADGEPLTVRTDVATSYTLEESNVKPKDQLQSTLTYSGDGPTLALTTTLSRIDLGALLGDFSLSQGFSITWTGPALVKGEQLTVLIRSADSPNPNDADIGEFYGEVGSVNGQLWIDGDTLRVAPAYFPTDHPMRVGQKYELRVVRGQAAHDHMDMAEYQSNRVTVTAVE